MGPLAMIAVAFVAFGLSVIWTAFVVFANVMSDADYRQREKPVAPFQGAWTLWVCWLVTAALAAGALS